MPQVEPLTEKIMAKILLPLLALQLVVTPAAAQKTSKPPRPVQFQKLVECRAIAEPGARLACFDRETAAFEAAEKGNDLVVVDRQQIRNTRRSLFGLTLPKIPFLDDGDEEAGTAQIEGVVRSARVDGDKWTVDLDGSTWRTTEGAQFETPPKAGQKAIVRRAALGSYVLKIEGRKGLRAIRVR